MASNPLALPAKVYDRLKPVATTVLPAAITLWLGLALLWGLPYAEQVGGTLALVNTFLGALLGVSSALYKTDDRRFDGDLQVDEKDSKLVYGLELQTVPEKLKDLDQVVLKVKRVPDTTMVLDNRDEEELG